MIARSLILVAVTTIIAGCATKPPSAELPANHPANPKAREADARSLVTPTLLAANNIRPDPTADNGDDASPDEAASPDDHDSEKMQQHHHSHAAGKTDATVESAGSDVPDGQNEEDASPPERKAPSDAGSHESHKPSTAPTTAGAAAYVCPMHKMVVSDTPGKCPKCGMKLVVKKDAKTGAKMEMKMDAKASDHGGHE